MSDLKKLFKRDRFYWVIVTVSMTLLVIYMLANINADGMYHTLFNIEENLERSQFMHKLWDADLRNLELMKPRTPDGGFFNNIPLMFVEHMVPVTVMAALIAQAVKLLVQETQNRTEVLRTFPVKSSNIVTCHYLSGLLTAGIPLLVQTAIIRLDILYVEKNTDFFFMMKEQLWIYVVKAMIIFMLHYSLLIVCRKATNHVPGTIFTFIVVEFAMQPLAGYCLGMYWNNLADDSIKNWVFWAFVTVLLILLSYIADQKQDCARNGVYAFPAAHWAMMGAVFGEIYFIFHSTFEDIPKVVSFFVASAASLLMTAGVHFVAKPKKI